MSNFSDFVISNKTDNKERESNTQSKKYSKENLQSKIDEYSGFSQDRLMSEFIKLTIEKKKKGELSEKELSSLKNTIMPMLNREQQESLEKLLQLVRDVEEN